MAVKKVDQKIANGNGGGRLKFRYVDPERYVDLDVSHIDNNTAEQFRSLVTSLASRSQAAPKTLPAAPTSTAVLEAEETPEPTTIEVSAQAVETQEQETSSSSSERRKRIPPTPKLISDLDITAGQTPFRTFLEQKGPRKAQDRMAVVATWLKKHKNYQEIGRDHFYSVYQQMGGSGDWKCPNEWDALIRQLAKRKSWFEKGANEASYKVSIVCTNYVDAMTSSVAAA